MNIRNLYQGLMIMVACVFSGCGEAIVEQEVAGPISLTFNLFPDSVYRYSIKNNIALRQEIDEEKAISINQNMTLTNAYRVLAVKPERKTVSVTYERITMSSGNQLFSLDYDSENDNGTDPMYEDLRNLIDKDFKMVISSSGAVLESEPVRKAKNETTLAGSFDDSSIRKIMLHVLQVYPGKEVAEGDEWERTYATSVGFANVLVRNRYRLVSIKEGVAHVELQGRVNTLEPVQTQNSNMQLKGLQSGEMDIDVKSGLVLNGKISQQLEGNMNITGENTPVNIESDIYILGTVVKNELARQ